MATQDPWPHRRRMPELATLDEATRAVVRASVDQLVAHQDEWIEGFLAVTREYVPGYATLTDDEIRSSAHVFIQGEIDELLALRIPDDALRAQLEAHAQSRFGRGLSLETVTLAYQLGSRELLSLMDSIAAEVGLPADLLLAIHDSTWEFANEASGIFARVQRDASIEAARFDAERRAGFARGVLAGTVPVEVITRDAQLFGVVAHAPHVVVAARMDGTPSAVDDIRREITRVQRLSADRVLFAEIGSAIGGVLPAAQVGAIDERLVGVSEVVQLEDAHDGFVDALLALETGERFGLIGAVRLADLGPRPLVLQAESVGRQLELRTFAALDAERNADELRDTVRVYVDCDLSASEAGSRLVVHPNTVRYRVRRFSEVTGLDLTRTEDLITAWWLLNRR